MSQVVFYASDRMIHPGVQRAGINSVTGTGLNAAWVASAAAASVRSRKSSLTLHAVDLSTQLCACPSHGFWDSLDLSKFEDPVVAAFQFKSLTVIELKHGRVYTLACIGCIVPRVLQGSDQLSPSEELKLKDFPNQQRGYRTAVLANT